MKTRSPRVDHTIDRKSASGEQKERTVEKLRDLVDGLTEALRDTACFDSLVSPSSQLCWCDESLSRECVTPACIKARAVLDAGRDKKGGQRAGLVPPGRKKILKYHTYRDIRSALEELTKTLGPFLCTAEEGLPAVVKTIGDCADLHTAYRLSVKILDGEWIGNT